MYYVCIYKGVPVIKACEKLESLTVNFPLSSDYYPQFLEQKQLRSVYRLGSDSHKTYVDEAQGYNQNIVSITSNITLVSTVKLQLSLIKYFCPQMVSLHLHGLRGFQQSEATLEGEPQKENHEALSKSIEMKNKVFFGLEELCVYLSDNNVLFLSEYFHHLPVLKRLQVIYGRKSTVLQLRYLLEHLNENHLTRFHDRDGGGSNVVATGGVANEDEHVQSHDSSGSGNSGSTSTSSTSSTTGGNWLHYYLNYWYYSSQMNNTCRQLKYLYIVTKNTTCDSNIFLLSELRSFFEKKHSELKLTLLFVKVVIHFPFWDMDYLLSCVHELEQSYFFKRENFSFVISMPFKLPSAQDDWEAWQQAFASIMPSDSDDDHDHDHDEHDDHDDHDDHNANDNHHGHDRGYKHHSDNFNERPFRHNDVNDPTLQQTNRKVPLIDKQSLLGTYSYIAHAHVHIKKKKHTHTHNAMHML
ncbi:hypothetical protein RFI_02981 [Reticulomyxa filosa]|uniref:Uncharacterized protein n=1 Tax=Reticulomyxa filosa TaxID=46433 RepID=X6P7S2_RETFI|nr:hypothetical protein RFI_02981 [Reticulomyxa filosa]|eukprot:ETO34114.1 hypothetical protein RFI_02981 [Reticulomyxa filosa]